MNRGPGRPVAPDGPYDVQLKIRVATHQHRAILEYARERGESLSELIRSWIDATTKRGAR